MHVHVRLFAGLAEDAQRKELTLELSEGSTAQAVIDELICRYPGFEGLANALMVAVNQSYAATDTELRDGDEVAIIPPVSGGTGSLSDGTDGLDTGLFVVTEQPLSADDIMGRVINPMAGAVDVFVGTVREFTAGRRTVYLKYEAYKSMAERMMAQIGQEIGERWPGAETAMAHRVGELQIGEASVIIAVATPHRPEAFDACRYAIDRVKEIVPIWKKEHWEDGEAWVGTPPEDD